MTLCKDHTAHLSFHLITCQGMSLKLILGRFRESHRDLIKLNDRSVTVSTVDRQEQTVYTVYRSRDKELPKRSPTHRKGEKL